jgi:hypothetical protein
MPRYEVTGIPPQLAAGSQLGLSAFLPHYNRLAASGAQSYKGGVSGYPGTQRIPLQAVQNSVPSPDLGDIAQMGLSRSSDSPDAFWPNLYYDNPVAVGGKNGNDRFWPGAGMPVQIVRPCRPQDTTMIPVPATDLRSVYQSRAALLAGGVAGEQSRFQALKQATAFVKWRQRRTGNGPGTGSP